MYKPNDPRPVVILPLLPEARAADLPWYQFLNLGLFPYVPGRTPTYDCLLYEPSVDDLSFEAVATSPAMWMDITDMSWGDVAVQVRRFMDNRRPLETALFNSSNIPGDFDYDGEEVDAK